MPFIIRLLLSKDQSRWLSLSLYLYLCINKETSGNTVFFCVFLQFHFIRAWLTRVCVCVLIFSTHLLSGNGVINQNHFPSLSLSLPKRIDSMIESNIRRILCPKNFNHFSHLCATVIKTKLSSSINSLSHVNVCLFCFLFIHIFDFTANDPIDD